MPGGLQDGAMHQRARGDTRVLPEQPHSEAPAVNWGVPGSDWEVQNPAQGQTREFCLRSTPSPQHHSTAMAGLSPGLGCSPQAQGAPAVRELTALVPQTLILYFGGITDGQCPAGKAGRTVRAGACLGLLLVGFSPVAHGNPGCEMLALTQCPSACFRSPLTVQPLNRQH